MKKISTFLAICVMLIYGCTSDIKTISQQDIDFVSALKKSDNNIDNKERIDSVLALHNTNEAQTALLLVRKGTELSKLYKYEEAIENLNRALPFFNSIDNKEYLAETYWLLGMSNAFLSNTVIANEQLLTALQYSKEINDKKKEANIYGSLAHTLYLVNDFATSINYTKKSIDIYTTINDTLGLSSAYNNLAVVYKNTNDLHNALVYNNKSLDLNKLQKDTSAIAMSYNNLGLVSVLLRDDKSAIEYFNKAKEMNKSKNILNSSPLENMADTYLEQRNIDLAESYFKQALEIESQKNNIRKKIVLYSKLLQITFQKKDFESAMFYQKKRDSFNTVQSIKNEQEKLTIVKNQYQLETSKQNLKIEKELNNRNKIIFIVILCIIFLIGLFWLQNGRNKVLKSEKDKIVLEQKLLRSQMNPHFIFNALSSIQNSLLDEDPVKTARYLSRFAKLIRQYFDFSQERMISLFDELDSLKNYLDTQKIRFGNKFDYNINVDPNIDSQETNTPPLLLQPFVENSIEHGFKNKKDKGIIDINISIQGNYILYEIIDNGKGFNLSKKDQKDHAIDIFKKRLKLLGNNDEKSFKVISNEKGTTIKYTIAQ